MTHQYALFESHVELCKSQQKSTGVEELSVVLTFNTDSYSANGIQ